MAPQDNYGSTNPKQSNAGSAKHNWPSEMESEHQIELFLWKTQPFS